MILMYHRIGDVEEHGDPWGLTVTAEQFEQQMQTLASMREPMSLHALVQGLSDHSLSPNAVSVTFDDGYADNLHLAKPILARLGVPATLFVATGFLGKQVFWWDCLQRIVWTSGEIPREIRLELGDETLTVALAEERPVSRLQALSRLWELLRDMHPDKRDEILLALKRSLNSSDAESQFRPLTANELLSLIADDIFSIGAHTESHSWWPILSPVERRREIARALQVCNRITGITPTLFSYPYGAHTPDARNELVEAGVFAACTVQQTSVASDCDPYFLPRFAAPNNMDDFLRIFRSQA